MSLPRRVAQILDEHVTFELEGIDRMYLNAYVPRLQLTQGKMTYDLRRLRLHGIIERIPKSHRYRLTPFGLRTALFMTRVYNRVLRPGLADVTPVAPASGSRLRSSFDKLDRAIAHCCTHAKLAA